MAGVVTRIARTVALFGVVAWSVVSLPLPAPPAQTAAPLRNPAASPTVVGTSTATALAVAPTATAVTLTDPQAAMLRGTVHDTLHALPTAAPTATPAPAPTSTSTPTPMTGGPLGSHRLVTWYGHPDSRLMGILGEFDDPRAMIANLKAQAAEYTAADPAHPAIPTIELIASVASDSPGQDGLFLNPTRPEVLEQYVQMAQDNDCLLLLDVQFGYDTLAHEMQRLLPYLKTGHVHLALDPEFHVKRGEVPGDVFGSLSAAEVTAAQKMLADLVGEYHLPDKVLVVHQFRIDMLPDKSAIKVMPHVQVAIMMDGFGGPEAKIGNYNAFIRDEPIQFGGIKLFYKQDKPLMSPKDIIALSPTPMVVSYQ